MARDKDSVVVNFGLGIDQQSPDTSLLYDNKRKQYAARRAVNVDITDSGNLRRRKGAELVFSGDNVHSLGGNEQVTLYVDSGTLYRLNSDETSTTIRTGLSPSRLMSYETINNELYYSNGEVIGRIINGTTDKAVGVEVPAGQPTLSPADGALEAATYQVAITYVSAAREESGTGPSATITLASTGSIGLTNIPQPVSNEVEVIRIYVSAPNGDKLYYAATIPVGMTSAEVDVVHMGRMLTTQFCQPMPPGHILRYYNGRLYVASDNLIFYSDPQVYGRCKISSNFMNLASRVTMIEPVGEGLYVSTSTEVFYVAGGGPSKDMTLTRVSETPAVEGSSKIVKPEVLGIDGISGDSDVAVWFTNAGWVAGLPNGTVQYLTRDRLALPEYSQATTLLRMVDGMSQLITIPRGNGVDASAFASDSMEAEIVRNGVIVS
jgi:hypothetical protein